MSSKDIENLDVLHRNRVQSRSYFLPYRTEAQALTYDRGTLFMEPNWVEK
jgi:hypothetical protein